MKGGVLKSGLLSLFTSKPRYSIRYWCWECQIILGRDSKLSSGSISVYIAVHVPLKLTNIKSHSRHYFYFTYKISNEHCCRLPESAVLSGCVWSLPPVEQESSLPQFQRSCSRWLVSRIATPLQRVPLVPLETLVSTLVRLKIVRWNRSVIFCIVHIRLVHIRLVGFCKCVFAYKTIKCFLSFLARINHSR